MPELVDYDPFEAQGVTPATPEPVDYDPFKVAEAGQTPATVVAQPQKVDYDPFNTTSKAASTVDDSPRPGFGTTLLAAGSKGLQEGTQEVSDFFTQAKAKLLGEGPFFDPSQQKHEVPSEADSWLKAPFFENWTKPEWYAAQVAYGVGKTYPQLAAGLVGGVAGGTPGAAAGLGGSSFALSLIPAFRAAKEKGLSDDDAIAEAAKVAAVNGGTMALMGVAGGAGFTGTISREIADGAVANALKYPVRETLVQLGLVQPTIGAAGQIAGAEAAGRTATPDEVAGGFATNIVMGVPFVAPHVAGMARPRSTTPAARPETVNQAFETQARGPVLAEDTQSLPSPTFYSEARRVVETKGPSAASGQQWLATLRNSPGVKAEEIEGLNLPAWLENSEGKISKADVLAHIEEHGLQLEEVNLQDGPPKAPSWTEVPRRTTQYDEYTLPGPKESYGELLLKLPQPDRQQQFLKTGSYDTPAPFQAPHFGDQGQNLLAHARYSGRVDRDGKRTLFIEEIQSDWHQKGRREGYAEAVKPFGEIREGNFEGYRYGLFNEDGVLLDANNDRGTLQALNNQNKGVPDAPFKTSWPELVFKRMMRYAADNGYERIAWTNGEQQIARYSRGAIGLDANQSNGMREFYDKLLPRIASKWGKKLGMAEGETAFQSDVAIENYGLRDVLMNAFDGRLSKGSSSRVRFVDVSPAAGSRIRMGLPLYERVQGTLKEAPVRDGEISGLRDGARAAIKTVQRLEASMLKGSDKLNFEIVNSPQEQFRAQYGPRDKVVVLNLAHFKTVEDMYSTLAHEFGHHVMYEKFGKASDTVRTAVHEAFALFRARVYQPDTTFGSLLQNRTSAITEFYSTRRPSDSQTPLLSMTSEQRAYWGGFKEWFADQVSKWATTEERPLTLVDRFFSALGGAVRAVLKTMTERLPNIRWQPEKAMKEWLDDLLGQQIPLGPDEIAQTQLNTLRKNQAAMDRAGAPETPATPETASTGGGRSIADSAGAGDNGREMAAHADRMNWFYKYMTHLLQVAQANPHIRGLQYYKELISLAHLEMNTMQSEAMVTAKMGRKLSGPQQEAMARFIDDYIQGKFMDPKEIAKSGLRKPTADEFTALVAKHKLGDAAVKTFEAMTGDFSRMLERYRSQLLRETSRIKDPIAQSKAMADIDQRIESMANKPYMPSMRFGDFTVTVYGPTGDVRHFETFETARQQRKAAEEIRKSAAADEKVLPGFIKKDVRPLLGMPPGLLDLMAEKLSLSDSQKAAMDQLKFEYAPAQSFRHRFQNKELTPGWSQEWIRAYANYMWHGARHFARVKYADQLRDQVQGVWKERFARQDATKIDQIRNYMSDHLQNWLDPKPDWAQLRGMMFHWYLGFSPSAAAINLSQTPLMTYPFLASKFGDLRAIGAMARVGSDMTTYYRQPSLSKMTSRDARALAEAHNEGVISETQAHELAGIGENRNLLKGFGAGTERFAEQAKEYSAKMFEIAEKWNRRVAFRSAWKLALENTGSKYVKDMVEANPLQYNRLKDKGWTDQEAAAFVAAKDATESTQFVYAPYARARFMRGRVGSLFVFKSFLQNSLMALWNNKPMAARTLLILAGTAGLTGLPGAEDLKSLVKGIGARFFGKDWDAEDEIRKYVLDLTGGAVKPDLLLHGISHYGFGLPQAADLMGQLTGLRPPVPSVDLSKSLSMGNILPFDVGKMITPAKDSAPVAVREIQRASGAMFGLGFSLYNFLNSDPWNLPDRKKWEQIMPRAAANASQAFRFWNEGQERNKLGNAVVRFDPSDATQAAEIIAKGLGFQPTRLTERWDNILAKSEALAYWDIRRQVLIRQAFSAWQAGDKEKFAEMKQNIREFNRQIPQELKGQAITGEALQQSFENKVLNRRKQELGVPLKPRDLGVIRQIDKLYPGGSAPAGVIGVKPVR